VRRYGIHKLAAKVCHIHISPDSSLVAHVGDLTSDKSKSSEFNTLEQSPPFSFLLHREPNAVFFWQLSCSLVRIVIAYISPKRLFALKLFEIFVLQVILLWNQLCLGELTGPLPLNWCDSITWLVSHLKNKVNAISTVTILFFQAKEQPLNLLTLLLVYIAFAGRHE